jgi:hypothetical protein
MSEQDNYSDQRRGPHRWQRGVSGNPSGRKPGPWTLARAVREAWPPERLVELASELAASADESIRMRALEWLPLALGAFATSKAATARPRSSTCQPSICEHDTGHGRARDYVRAAAHRARRHRCSVSPTGSMRAIAGGAGNANNRVRLRTRVHPPRPRSNNNMLCAFFPLQSARAR